MPKADFSLKNPHTIPKGPTIPWQISEKTNLLIPRKFKLLERQKDRQKDQQKNGQKDEQKNRQKDRQTLIYRNLLAMARGPIKHLPTFAND